MKRIFLVSISVFLFAWASVQAQTTGADYYNRGVGRLNKRMYDEAIADFTKAIELNPRHAEAYFRRGFTLLQKKERDAALVDFDKAIELDSKNGGYYYFRADARDLLDHDARISDYTKALELDPIDPRPLYERGYIKFVQKNFEGAIADYTKGLERKISDSDIQARVYSHDGPDLLDTNMEPSLYFARGRAYLAIKQFDNAIADLTRSIEARPDALAYADRGKAHLAKKNFEKAIADFTKALEDLYNSFTTYEARADAYEQIGEKEKAEADRRKAAETKQKLRDRLTKSP